jgi:hypothetical protein
LSLQVEGVDGLSAYVSLVNLDEDGDCDAVGIPPLTEAGATQLPLSFLRNDGSNGFTPW